MTNFLKHVFLLSLEPSGQLCAERAHGQQNASQFDCVAGIAEVKATDSLFHEEYGLGMC